MKKHNLISLMLLAPIVLWAQVVPVDSAPSDIDLSDVVIIEDVAEPIESSRAQAANALAPELTDGASTSLVDAATSPVDTVEAPDPVAAAALSGFGDIAAVRADEAAAPQPSTVLAEPEAGLDGVGEVVEILDTPTAGVVVDVQAAEVLAVASTALPSDSEVLLELPGQETSGPGSVAMAAEETISVDFPDEEVRIILRNVADLFDLNLVIPDTLQGRTSVKLRNITWRQVFEVALEPLGFTYVEDRNIIRIKSIAELTTEPVDTRVFILNYARADDIQGSVSPLIDAAAGGKIQVDVRSNALVITERPSRMNRIQEVIDTLDRATDQVMIESKFIEVSNGDLSDIGVDWAYLNENASDLLGGSGAGSGNPGFSPHPYDLDTKTIPTPNGSVFAGVDSYANGLANIAAGGASGGLVAVFSSSQFAATLTAIQTENRSKLVSNPTVVVMNNQQAVFQVGEDYPIREFSVNDETGQLETGEIDYRFVGIELDVTPSVNAAGMITLDVHPVVSALGDVVPTNVGGAILEDRIFKKRDAKTQVTIKDGYTIALGGLTAETEDNDSSKIPFLGDLPFLGQLFRSDVSNVASTNLIIFLTAKTLNPDGSTYADVIDPRQLEVMQLTPAQIPGYEVPADELELIHSIEAKRAQEISKEYKSKINTAIDGPKASKARWFK